MDLFWFIMLSMISFGESVQFCDQLIQNGNKISFTYRYMKSMVGNDMYRNYVFIGDYFWKLNYLDGNDNKSVTIDNQNSRKSDTFGSQYSMAFCLWFKDHCKTGLFKKSDGIDWVEVDESLNITKQLTDKTRLNFPSGFDPYLGWVSSSAQDRERLVIFMDNTKHKFAGCLMPNINSDITCISDDTQSHLAKHRDIYESIDPKLNIIGIIAQYSDEDYKKATSAPRTYKGQGIIILSQSGLVINWCYKSLDPVWAKTQCAANQFKPLIDCTQDVKTTVTVAPESPTISRNIIWILFAVIVAVIVIIGIVFIVCFFAKKDENTIYSKVDDSVSSRVSAVRSGVKSDDKSSIKSSVKSSVKSNAK